MVAQLIVRVSNLSGSTTEEHLREIIQPIAAIDQVIMPEPVMWLRCPIGRAEIICVTEDDAKSVYARLNGASLDGNRISVAFTRVDPSLPQCTPAQKQHVYSGGQYSSANPGNRQLQQQPYNRRQWVSSRDYNESSNKRQRERSPYRPRGRTPDRYRRRSYSRSPSYSSSRRSYSRRSSSGSYSYSDSYSSASSRSETPRTPSDNYNRRHRVGGDSGSERGGSRKQRGGNDYRGGNYRR